MRAARRPTSTSSSTWWESWSPSPSSAAPDRWFLLVVSLDGDRTRIEVSDGLSLAGDLSPLRDQILDAITSATGITDISGGRMLWAEVEV